jgi:hypothetical protein
MRQKMEIKNNVTAAIIQHEQNRYLRIGGSWYQLGPSGFYDDLKVVLGTKEVQLEKMYREMKEARHNHVQGTP